MPAPHFKLSLCFKAIAFDLDGTIADTAPDLASALNAALVSLGRMPVDLDTVRSLIGHGTLAMLRKGLAVTGGCDEALVEAGYPVLMRHYEAHICHLTRAYPGVEAAFDALAARGMALALCTNKPSALTHRLVDALGWSDRFAAIVGGDTLAVCKPDPAPLHLAIERAGGGRAVFVGDSSVDIAIGTSPCLVRKRRTNLAMHAEFGNIEAGRERNRFPRVSIQCPRHSFGRPRSIFSR